MAEYIGTAVVQDLPVEIMEEVLNKLDYSKQRNEARLVNPVPVWSEILNRNSSIERFHVTKNLKNKNGIPNDHLATVQDILRSFNRRKVDYDFRMDGSAETKLFVWFESFFKESGKNINLLSMSLNILNVDPSELQIIAENCPNLKTVRLQMHMTDSKGWNVLPLNDCDITFPSVKEVKVERNLNIPTYFTTCITIGLVRDLLKTFPNSRCIEIVGTGKLADFHQRFKSQLLNENARIIIHEFNRVQSSIGRPNSITYGNIALGEPTIINKNRNLEHNERLGRRSLDAPNNMQGVMREILLKTKDAHDKANELFAEINQLNKRKEALRAQMRQVVEQIHQREEELYDFNAQCNKICK